MNSGIEDVFEYGKEGKGFAAGNHAKDVNLGIALTVPIRFFWAIVGQALASRSKAVQPSPTMLFGGLALTRFTGMTGRFFDN